MKEFAKKLWKDPVWSTVIATAVIALLASAGAYLLDLWPLISGIAISLWSITISETKTPNWVLGSLIIINAILIIQLALHFIKRAPQSQVEYRNFKRYIRDEVEGILWSWDYHGNRIANLHSLCPSCQYEIIPSAEYDIRGVSFRYKCEDCGNDIGIFDPDDLNQRVILKIQQNIRTGRWKSKRSLEGTK